MPASRLTQRLARGENLRLRGLLADAFGDRGAHTLLTEFGGNVGQEAKDISELAGRIGERHPGPDRMRTPGKFRGHRDIARGLHLLQQGGLPVQARFAASPARVSGTREVTGNAGPLLQRPVGMGTSGGRDVQGRIDLAGAREAGAAADEAQARARVARNTPATPLEAEHQRATARSFRTRRGGTFVDVENPNALPGDRRLRVTGTRPRIDESGQVELRQDAETFRDPNFEAAQGARQADLFTGAGGGSPAIATALIQQQTARERNASRQAIENSRGNFLLERERLRSQGVSDALADRLAAQREIASLDAAGTFLNAQINAQRFAPSGAFGFGGGVDDQTQAALDMMRDLVTNYREILDRPVEAPAQNAPTGGPGDAAVAPAGPAPGGRQEFNEGDIFPFADGRQGVIVRDPITGELFVEIQ